jgi:hypothetical protein
MVNIHSLGLLIMIMVLLATLYWAWAYERLKGAIEALNYTRYTPQCVAPVAGDSEAVFVAFNPFVNISAYLVASINTSQCGVGGIVSNWAIPN